jgi:predicted O-methyltransferase YrrM
MHLPRYANAFTGLREVGHHGILAGERMSMQEGARPRPRAAWRHPRFVQKTVGRAQKLIDYFRYRDWFKSAELTTDWTSGNLPHWRRVLSPWRGEPLRILEIGSWEGRSALFFLNFFPRSTIVCIDFFADIATLTDRPLVEGRFDRNVAPFGERVEKIKSLAIPALERLAADGRRFDLAYIDGGHTYDMVMKDSILVWALTEPRSVIIWDDYRYGLDRPPEERAQTAIDEFLRDHAGRYRLLRKDYQVMIERLQ